MANKFANIAKKQTTLSPIMENRTKLSTEELIKQYPNGVTVCEFDMIEIGDESFPVFTFAEDETRFVFGGTVLGNIVYAWVSDYDGDIEGASKALNAVGGVKMRFSKGRTKNGNNITLVDVVG